MFMRRISTSKAALIGLSLAVAGAGVAMQLSPPPARAQAAPESFSVDDLKRVEAARDAALKRLRDIESAGASAQREAEAIDTDLLAAAADSHDREEAAGETEVRLAAMEAEAQAAFDQIGEDQRASEDLLAALILFDNRRAPALAASPQDSGQAIRAAILMGEAAPALASRAGDLRAKIDRLNAAIEGAHREREQLKTEEAALAARRTEIEALAAEKRMASDSLASEAAAARAESEKLAREAETLRDLLDSLARAAPSRPGAKPVPGKPAANSPPRPTPRPTASATTSAPRAAATGPASAGVRPVVGKILRRFGQSVDGAKLPGTTYATRAGAQVLAPKDARVEYAGAFRSYGQMLILDVGEDYLVVVSGLDALYPQAGQKVLAGEPVGRMADRASPAPELYFEVRRGGQPIDPEGWLTRGR